MSHSRVLHMGLIFTIAVVGLTLSTTRTDAQPGGPDDLSEKALIERIKRLGSVVPTDVSKGQPFAVRAAGSQQLVTDVDTLLARFPNTTFKDEALILQLGALAELARVHPDYLRGLLMLTDEITSRHPKGRLASENAFYAIQAFVLGARAENMPQKRRLVGTQERYAAFLDDFPHSERAAVIRASLIRNLIAQGLLDRAREEYAELKRTHPEHKATRRAQGELYRAVAVGQPFAFGYTTPDGQSIRTANYIGHVLVVHFWATWSRPSLEQLPELIDLHGEFKDQGLRLIGVNIDKDGDRIEETLRTHKMPWPQYFDHKGFENDVLVTHGVLKVPTYFVVDRHGILRSTNPGDKLRELVKDLLGKSDPKP